MTPQRTPSLCQSCTLLILELALLYKFGGLKGLCRNDRSLFRALSEAKLRETSLSYC